MITEEHNYIDQNILIEQSLTQQFTCTQYTQSYNGHHSLAVMLTIVTNLVNDSRRLVEIMLQILIIILF